jgi:hypothetical protein
MSIEDIQIKALNTLIGAVRLAHSKGCFSLDEAGEISNAVSVFLVPQEESPDESSNNPEAEEKVKSKSKK